MTQSRGEGGRGAAAAHTLPPALLPQARPQIPGSPIVPDPRGPGMKGRCTLAQPVLCACFLAQTSPRPWLPSQQGRRAPILVPEAQQALLG